MTLALRPIGRVLALTCFVTVCASAAQAGCRSICISERHWTQLVAEHKTDVYWGPSVGPAKCGEECAGGACKDGARNHGRCGRVCGEKGEYACYGQKRGWNYSWRLP